MAGKKGKSGGARAGSGRKAKPSRDISDLVKSGIVDAAEKLAKEHGKTIEEAMLEMIYAPKKEVQASVKMAIWKAYNEVMVIKESESHVDMTHNKGPGIFLPESRPDPAKVIPIKKEG